MRIPLEDALGDDLDCAEPDTSFSPFYSDVGLGVSKEGGIDALFFHYNRYTTTFGRPFLDLRLPAKIVKRNATGVEQIFEKGALSISFTGHNAWIIETTGLPEITWSFQGHDRLTEARSERLDETTLLFRGFLPSIDERTPDRNFPFAIALRILEGEAIGGDGIQGPLRIEATCGRIRLAFIARAEETDVSFFLERLASRDVTVEVARERTRSWLAKAAGARAELRGGGEARRTAARAIHSLVSNASLAPGFLAGRVASFPSRGKYPTHFLWDACFQNLALESMEPRLAEDGLLLLTESLRPDGKMAHFLCSTWVRPHDSQPPLVGWAGLRLVKARNDLGLAAKLLPALRRNNAWWLSHRATRFGLISTLSGLETGWDDSPRFDEGPTVACDMNAYLLMQMRATAELTRLLGNETEARDEEIRADAFASRMIEVLFDEASGLFFDRHVESGRSVRIKTPACFLPLLAGVPLPVEKAMALVRDGLLRKDWFYGDVPFPSVAYDEPTYESAKWWRGPTWPPVAFFMIQILEKFGFDEEATASKKRLHRLILEAGDLRELFDSKSGEGLGAKEQGWTAAIFLALDGQIDRTP